MFLSSKKDRKIKRPFRRHKTAPVFWLVLLAFQLLRLSTQGQSLEIHQIAVDNADAGTIIVRDMNNVWNTLDYEILRRLLDANGFIAINQVLDQEVKALFPGDSTKTYKDVPNQAFTHWLQKNLQGQTFNQLEAKRKELFAADPVSDDSKASGVNATQILVQLAAIDHHFLTNAPITKPPTNVLAGTVKHTTVIDAGRSAYGGDVYQYLSSQGVQRIDRFILSHKHSDHYGGFKALLKSGIELGEVCMPSIEYPTAPAAFSDKKLSDIYERFYLPLIMRFSPDSLKQPLLDAVKGKRRNKANEYLAVCLKDLFTRQKLKEVNPKDVLWLDEQVGNPDRASKLFCVAANRGVINGVPKVDYAHYKHQGKKRNDNDFSLAFILSYNNFTYYTAGDLSGASSTWHDGWGNGCSSYDNVELPLSKRLKGAGIKNNGHVCAFKVSHHGSQCSNSTELLRVLDPIVAVVPNDQDNEHGNADPRFYGRMVELSRANPRLTIEDIYALGQMKNGTLRKQQIVAGYIEGTEYVPWSLSPYEDQDDSVNIIILNEISTTTANTRKVPRVVIAGNTVIVVSDHPGGTHSDFIVRHDGKFARKGNTDVVGNEPTQNTNKQWVNKPKMEVPAAGIADYRCTKH